MGYHLEGWVAIAPSGKLCRNNFFSGKILQSIECSEFRIAGSAVQGLFWFVLVGGAAKQKIVHFIKQLN